MLNLSFKNASEAFYTLYKEINSSGITREDTTALFNIGFYIENPLDNIITSEARKWNLKYAEYEWNWYLIGNPNAREISERAPIWKNHMDEHGNVVSNYGFQWQRNNQLEEIINKLKKDPATRQAVISIYDGKEISYYKKDTPCTLSIHFQIIEDKLCMTVNMRSNDLWYGFCNDQYCFSKLQELISNKINKKVGWYYHFSSNMHLYNIFLNKQI
jgi:thymidylate synthase